MWLCLCVCVCVDVCACVCVCVCVLICVCVRPLNGTVFPLRAHPFRSTVDVVSVFVWLCALWCCCVFLCTHCVFVPPAGQPLFTVGTVVYEATRTDTVTVTGRKPLRQPHTAKPVYSDSDSDDGLTGWK